MHDYSDFGINLGGKKAGPDGEISTLCPKCSHTRSPAGQKKPCLRVNVSKGTWCCQHPTCGWKGGLGAGSRDDIHVARTPVVYRPNPTRDPRLIEWFHRRGISAEIVAAHAISLTSRYFASTGDADAIAFPYYFNGEVVNVKYRSLEGKNFSQEKGGLKVLYGIDNLRGSTVCVVVEGEIDAITLGSCGIPYGVSVPDGAPAPGSKSTDLKFEYLQNCKAQLDTLTKIIIAVDNDAPGKTLEAELIRRLGPDRCWRVTWPEGCKDANDVLLKHGADELRRCVDEAKPMPLIGVVEVDDIWADVLDLYDRGLPPGESTGWPILDEHYNCAPGQLTVVGGIPNMGKTDWQDALMVNLADKSGWGFVICSPEKTAKKHVADIAQKHSGLQFGTKYPNGPRISRDRLEVVEMPWINRHFTWVAPDKMITIDGLMKYAKAVITRKDNVRGLVIDPFNEFDHRRPDNMSMTEYISATLSDLKRWAVAHGVHVWIIVHPTKLLKDKTTGKYPVPTPYDASDSAGWRNKADCYLTIHRDLTVYGSPTEVHVQKIRYQPECGKLGMVTMRRNALNGRYEAIEAFS